ncbi:hypothetical protein EXIGLDRAFT_515964 [Exidia glandulosa HHB12029]|uniref:AAA+ ATPase domain-containing protein n=1 Tax=Exidia glandulosa HHB12029 TaxID=1314781 RepID=A0A166ARQ7_EXIGL|nr:hypothetical protein EXIGLDRAFT_515964 [Exidia glandulosa HHB12029]
MTRASHALMSPKDHNPAEMPPPPVSPLSVRANRGAKLSLLIDRLPPRPHLLIGRDDELVRAVDALTLSSSNHVSIMGAPGIGKTTLALSVLHNEGTVEQFDRRRFYIACAAHGSVSSLLASLGMNNVKQLVAFLRSSQPSLLLLDNFDVTLAGDREAAEALINTLGAADNLTLLLTMRGAEIGSGSVKMERHVLGPLTPHASEQLFLSLSEYTPSDSPLTPFSPASFSPTSPSSTSSLSSPTSAVSTAATSVSISSTTSQDVQKIIAEADGVPLALTLLAHRPPGNHNSSSSSSSSLTEHEQNRLDAVIASSVAHIDASGAEALALLARASSGLIRALLPARGIAALLRTALAYRQPDHSGEEEEERIRVLAPIRSYALAHLPPSAAGLSQLRAHYINLAMRAGEIGGSATPTVVRLLEREAGNLNCVLRESVTEQSGQGVDAMKGCVALGVWGAWVGSQDRGLLEVVVDALRHRGDRKPEADDGDAKGKAKREDGLLNEALMALSRLYAPSSTQARALIDEALVAARRAGDIGLEIDALARRCVVDEPRDLDRLGRAQELLRRYDADDSSVEIRRARVWLELGQLHLSASRYAKAKYYFTLTSQLSLTNALHLRARTLFSLGHILGYEGHLRQASAKYTEAMAAFESADMGPGVSHCLNYQAWANLHREKYAEAYALYTEAARRFRSLGTYEMDECLARCGAVRAACAMGRTGDELKLELPELPSDWVFGRGVVHAARGEIAMHVGEYGAARDCFHAAKAAFKVRGIPEKIADCEMLRGEALLAEGAVEEGECVMALSFALFRQNGSVVGCRDVLRRWGHRVHHTFVEGGEEVG